MTLLRSRAFRWYFIGRTTSTFGSSFGILALTFGVLHFGGGAIDLGLVLAAPALPAVVFILLGGVLADRFERRTIVVLADLMMALTQALTCLMFAVGWYNVWALVVIQLIRGTASAFFLPAATGILPTIVPKEHLREANALLEVAQNVVSVVAPGVAGVVVAIYGPAVALGVDAGTFFISACFVALVPAAVRKAGDTQTKSKNRGIWIDLRVGWREFASRPWVWQMVVSFSIYQATLLPAIALLGPVVFEDNGYGVAGWAAVLAARAIGSVVGGLVAFKVRVSRPLLLCVMLVLLDAPFLLAIASSLPVGWVSAAGLLSAAGVAVAGTLWVTTLQSRIPPDAISRVSSYDWLGSLSLNPVGNVVIGVVAAAFGAPIVIYVVVFILVAMQLLLTMSASIRARQDDV
ncbi:MULTISPECIES: MFS transporter [Microbacterium]|uniref:Enterobactin exporter EntS n=1 Tax=Microbacterium oxydans TaxID=82380 RepID=A0A3S9WG87_9MICO|nr:MULTISPECIES: MFS transporter [Microbacterium]AZS39081.1 Enterobactin exporter EntS [Microbacterium oxydans]KKX99179.1 hypothetical protein AAY78_03220 [Microbacterium sp. Ag1]